MTTKTIGLNASQRDWAKAHDWYLSSFVNSHNLYTVIVRNDLPTPSEVHENGVEAGTLVFKDYKSLREWAGY